MLKTKKYLIHTTKQISQLGCGDRRLAFTFRDIGERSTIQFEAQIANFFAYEEQLAEHLASLGWSEKPWNKNILYFAVANNLSEVQKRCHFDAADHLGAAETYLLQENLAILLTEGYANLRPQCVLVLGIFETKVEISIIEDMRFLYLKTWYADVELMLDTSELHDLLQRYLDDLSSRHDIKAFLLLDDTSKMSAHLAMKYKFETIKDCSNLVLDGLVEASRNSASCLQGK